MNEQWRQRWLPLVVAVVAAVLSLVSLTVTVSDEDSDGRPDKATGNVSFKVNEAPNDGQPTTTVTVPKPVVNSMQTALEKDLKEPPVEAEKVAPEQLEAADEAAKEIAITQTPLPTGGATQEVPGCVTRFVGNQNSRGGVRPQQHWLHYTVSPNRPGWSDVWAVVGLFDRPSFKASSHFVIDREGHCAYIVPIENNAWTQAGANRFAVGYEIINSGREASFLDTPGYTKLASVMRTVKQRTGIPLTRGEVRGCVPAKKGVVQHKDGGICAGGHVDITPFDVEQVVRIVNGLVAQSSVKATKRQVVACRKLNWWRKAREKGQARRNAVLRKKVLRKRGYNCLRSGLVRR